MGAQRHSNIVGCFHTVLALALIIGCTKSSSRALEAAHEEQGQANSDSCAVSMAGKAINSVIPAPRPHWVGDGFNVYPVFGNLAFTNQLSPFLMFDYGAPKRFEPTSKRRGVGDHPHRGFETVTVAFQGEIEHGDRRGNRGVIGPGDVQWMTAASGIVHNEFHSDKFAKEGGTLEMCQLWVNLPAQHKMDPPRYQEILSDSIPVVSLGNNGSVRVIAGQFMEATGPAQTCTPVSLWDIRIEPGRAVEIEVPEGHNTLIFVRRGKAQVGDSGVVGPQGTVRLELEGTSVTLEALAEGTQLLLLGGEPIDEPIAARGPFVMNTMKEIEQANRDFHSGKLG